MRDEYLPAPVTAPSRPKNYRSIINHCFVWVLECCLPLFGNSSRNDPDSDDAEEATEGNPRQTEVIADPREAVACEIFNTPDTIQGDHLDTPEAPELHHLITPQTAESGHPNSEEAADWSFLDAQEDTEWDPFRDTEVSERDPVEAEEVPELDPVSPEQAAQWAAEWEAAEAAAEVPSFKLSEDDLEFLDDWDIRFYNILHEQGKFDGHRLDENDPVLRVAWLYSGECNEYKKCRVFFEWTD